MRDIEEKEESARGESQTRVTRRRGKFESNVGPSELDDRFETSTSMVLLDMVAIERVMKEPGAGMHMKGTRHAPVAEKWDSRQALLRELVASQSRSAVSSSSLFEQHRPCPPAAR